ncbi:hypothetical protein DSM104299_03950 [Baekduia alba]|uniref:hypothetical protein n=1 Tax=Baekduia alba TaxID=2997333 RepID=UPI002340E1B1|nr:hypothetical protein [Baekduia alba]WCB95207.1 hypothetical protein DSM104299_03950 [Baekduia alba]
MRSPTPRLIGSATLAVAAAALLAACGNSSSDKPGYCGDRSDLQQSVSDLKSVNLTSVSAIQTQLTKVNDSAKALVASAKDDFPQQTSALRTSVSALDTSVKTLASAPSAAGAVQVGQNVASVVTAAQGFQDATKDKC